MNLTSNYIERIKLGESQMLDLPNGCKIHFIGIGGSSMSGLAEIVLTRGYKISGSDRVPSVNTDRLKSLGAKVSFGHDAQNVPDDCYLVVYTLAISSDNPEYLKALENNIPVIERGHFLGILTREHKYSVCVSGTHGKTTATSMIASVMLEANMDPSIHIGGNLPIIGGNARSSKSDYFVTEACEYHENFLNLSPYAGVVLNVEAEHLDYFKDIDAICSAFKKFIDLIPEEGFVVVCNESDYAIKAAKDARCKVYMYGFSDDCYFQAKDIELNQENTSFSIYIQGKYYANISLKVQGKHNVLNALATVAVCLKLGCDKDPIINGLNSFTSPDRRFQKRGYCNGAVVIDDYAHHPTELMVTMSSAKQTTKGRIFCVFQPHTYSRAKAFGDDFAMALKDCHTLIVSDIYPAREQNPGDISINTLIEKFVDQNINTLYISDFNDIATYLKKEVCENDTILILGAGNINNVIPLIFNN